CSLVRAEASRDASPEESLRFVNRHLIGRNARGMFVTVLYGVLHRGTGAFEYVRAGHDLPLAWDADGVSLTAKQGRAHPLGLFAPPRLDVQTLRIPAGGTLLLYTDGATEAADAQSELFGRERLSAAACTAPAASAQALCDHLVQAVAAYRGAAPQADD